VTAGEQRLPASAVVVVKDGQHPIAVLTMLASVVAGISGLLTPPTSSSTIDRLLPEPWRTWYYLLLLISGAIVTVAVWLPDIRDRLIWERVGLLPFTGVLLVYPLALINSKVAGLPLGVVIGALFGFGGLWRLLVISRELRRWRQTVRRLKEAEVAH
jgi:hypothetical protein